MASQFDTLRASFDKMDTASKGAFIENFTSLASKSAEHMEFLDECLQKYNAEIPADLPASHTKNVDINTPLGKRITEYEANGYALFWCSENKARLVDNTKYDKKKSLMMFAIGTFSIFIVANLLNGILGSIGIPPMLLTILAFGGFIVFRRVKNEANVATIYIDNNGKIVEEGNVLK